MLSPLVCFFFVYRRSSSRSEHSSFCRRGRNGVANVSLVERDDINYIQLLDIVWENCPKLFEDSFPVPQQEAECVKSVCVLKPLSTH